MTELNDLQFLAVTLGGSGVVIALAAWNAVRKEAKRQALVDKNYELRSESDAP